jgi:hypothetical protein
MIHMREQGLAERQRPIPERRISECCRWVIGHPQQRSGSLSWGCRWAASYGGDVPIREVAAGDIAAGDVGRLGDPQALRVERVLRVDAGVVLELRPVGLKVWETVRVTLPADRLVTGLGTAADWAGEASRACAPADIEPRRLMRELGQQ